MPFDNICYNTMDAAARTQTHTRTRCYPSLCALFFLQTMSLLWCSSWLQTTWASTTFLRRCPACRVLAPSSIPPPGRRCHLPVGGQAGCAA
jgi:hypothetical protein